MAKQTKPQVDEDFMKEIISRGLPVKHETSPKMEAGEILELPDKKPDVPADEPEPVPQAEIRQPARKKKATAGDYGETYFQKMELPDRQPIYVSRSTHEKLIKIVATLGKRKATVSSYAETIILHHFEQHQDEINELYQKSFENPV